MRKKSGKSGRWLKRDENLAAELRGTEPAEQDQRTRKTRQVDGKWRKERKAGD
ncbi:MAG: hypothetical protein ACOYJF_05210 [Prevotella sp.]